MTDRRFGRRIRITVVGPILVGTIFLFAMGVLGLVGALNSRNAVQRVYQESAKTLLASLSRQLRAPFAAQDLSGVQAILEGYLSEEEIIYTALRDTRGEIVLQNVESWQPDEANSFTLSVLAARENQIVTRRVGGKLLLCAPLSLGAEVLGTVQVAFSYHLPDQINVSSAQVMAPVLALLVIGFGPVFYLLVQIFSAPMLGLVSVMDQIGSGDFTTPVEEKGLLVEYAHLTGGLEKIRSAMQLLQWEFQAQLNVLKRRTEQLQVASQVARDTTALLDTGHLIQNVVTLIGARFGFYHVGIFLIDAGREWAVLKAASSQGGQRMMARNFRLRVGQEGLVGLMIHHGEAMVALQSVEGVAATQDTAQIIRSGALLIEPGDERSGMQPEGEQSQDAPMPGLQQPRLQQPRSLATPDLPDTRLEIAIPLRAGGDIIGALDLHSQTAIKFEAEDLAVYQILADQVGVAIRNAQLFQQVQDSLEVERLAYAEVGRQAWRDLLRSQLALHERYDPKGILPSATWRDEARQALRLRKTVTQADQTSVALATPIRVRDQVIGVIDAHKPPELGEWTPEEIGVLEALVDQLGVALDSARLFQESQGRAERERVFSEITSRVRASTNINDILQTAVRELAEALHLSQASIRLRPGLEQPKPPAAANPGSLRPLSPLSIDDGKASRPPSQGS